MYTILNCRVRGGVADLSAKLYVQSVDKYYRIILMMIARRYCRAISRVSRAHYQSSPRSEQTFVVSDLPDRGAVHSRAGRLEIVCEKRVQFFTCWKNSSRELADSKQPIFPSR